MSTSVTSRSKRAEDEETTEEPRPAPPPELDPRANGEYCMAIVVVGGQARNVGKTSLVANLIKAVPERRWTAVKISQHEHDLPPGASYVIREERDASGDGDTARYLRAGARRALLLSARPGCLADAIPALRRELGRADDVILESNSVLEFLEPDVYLAVLDPAIADFKSSARQYLQNASAVVLNEPERRSFRWDKAVLEQVMRKPIFRVRPPHYLTPDLVEFVRKKLQSLDQRA
jgi:predicted AAA+ superfamily ATPase